MGNSLKPHFERAEKTGACNLSKQGLTEFPEQLLKLTKCLRTLELSENKLPSIPREIGSFTLLKSLNISHNRLTSIPAEVGNLKKLEAFSMSNNRITTLPASLSKLQAVRDVNLSHNKLSVFPTQLAGLKNLDSLSLSHNNLVEIPEGVRHIQCIELNANQNQISRVSDAIAGCPRLKVLRLEENCLDLASITPTMLKDSQIAVLAVEGNMFEMKALRDVDGYEQYMERYTATKKKFN